MKVIDVYRQFFSATCLYHDIPRNGALVTLTATSEQGTIKYEVTLTFFPHTEPTDFAISYDAYLSKTIYENRGRRSKKREAAFLADLPNLATALAAKLNGQIHWDAPLRPANYA